MGTVIFIKEAEKVVDVRETEKYVILYKQSDFDSIIIVILVSHSSWLKIGQFI